MFKESFKYYKSKWPIPDLSAVLDFDDLSLKGVGQLAVRTSNSCKCIPFGVMPVDRWMCFELCERSGLIFIKNPFTARGQRYWITRCLRDYPKNPNVVNLSPTMFKEEVLNDWWTAMNSTRNNEFRKKLKNSMRWTTLGYHHDWDTKIYNEENKHPFPEDLSTLCSFFADVLGFGNYSAEAAIVNFYPIGTTLAGHTDHSEANLEAPLFSFSFGQTAIFLIGGNTKEEKPTALFLKSGDVVVMSKSSRLCYHAVPRVLKSSKDPWNLLTDDDIIPEDIYDSPPGIKRLKKSDEDSCNTDLELWAKCADDTFWSPFNSYLEDCRININVRQVLKEGQTSL